MAIYSSIIAWEIPWTEELGRLESMGSQRVKHDRATETQDGALVTADEPQWASPSSSKVCSFHEDLLLVLFSHYPVLSQLAAHWSSLVPLAAIAV